MARVFVRENGPENVARSALKIGAVSNAMNVRQITLALIVKLALVYMAPVMMGGQMTATALVRQAPAGKVKTATNAMNVGRERIVMFVQMVIMVTTARIDVNAAQIRNVMTD